MENEEMTREEIWDKFTDLPEDTMADMAGRATAYFFVFKVKDFDESIKNAAWALSEGYKTLVEMVEDGVNLNEFTMGDEEAWCVLDAVSDIIKTDSDLLTMLTEYKDEIVDGIEEDEDLMDEIKGECQIQLRLNRTKY